MFESTDAANKFFGGGGYAGAHTHKITTTPISIQNQQSEAAEQERDVCSFAVLSSVTCFRKR